MKVITFGEPLPASKDSDLFISYKVKGVPGGMLSGPYADIDYAKWEADDIRGYAGVKDVVLVTRRDLIKGTSHDQEAAQPVTTHHDHDRR